MKHQIMKVVYRWKCPVCKHEGTAYAIVEAPKPSSEHGKHLHLMRTAAITDAHEIAGGSLDCIYHIRVSVIQSHLAEVELG